MLTFLGKIVFSSEILHILLRQNLPEFAFLLSNEWTSSYCSSFFYVPSSMKLSCLLQLQFILSSWASQVSLRNGFSFSNNLTFFLATSIPVSPYMYKHISLYYMKWPTDAAICSQFHSTARSTLHVSGVLYTHHQEYNFQLYLQPLVQTIVSSQPLTPSVACGQATLEVSSWDDAMVFTGGCR